MAEFRMLARVKTGGKQREVGELVELSAVIAETLLGKEPPYVELVAEEPPAAGESAPEGDKKDPKEGPKKNAKGGNK